MRSGGLYHKTVTTTISEEGPKWWIYLRWTVGREGIEKQMEGNEFWYIITVHDTAGRINAFHWQDVGPPFSVVFLLVAVWGQNSSWKSQISGQALFAWTTVLWELLKCLSIVFEPFSPSPNHYSFSFFFVLLFLFSFWIEMAPISLSHLICRRWTSPVFDTVFLVDKRRGHFAVRDLIPKVFLVWVLDTWWGTALQI